MGGIFSTAAELEYNVAMGGLPTFVFFLIFVISSVIISFTEKEEDKTKTYGPVFGITAGLIITLIAYIIDYVKKNMSKARANLLGKRGVKDPELGAYIKGIMPITTNL